MNNTDKELLEIISDTSEYIGAYNIRKNGQAYERQITDNINIITKQDVSGIDVIIKENTKNEFIHIPVIITESGIKDVVYNDFYIGKNANVVIIAGCGIHNDHHADSQHDGIHRFFLEEGAKVKFNHAKNLPTNIDFTLFSEVSLEGCDLKDFESIQFRDGAKVDLSNVKNAPNTDITALIFLPFFIKIPFPIKKTGEPSSPVFCKVYNRLPILYPETSTPRRDVKARKVNDEVAFISSAPSGVILTSLGR